MRNTPFAIETVVTQLQISNFFTETHDKQGAGNKRIYSRILIFIKKTQKTAYSTLNMCHLDAWRAKMITKQILL